MVPRHIDFGGHSSGIVYVPTYVPERLTAVSETRFIDANDGDTWLSVSRARRVDVPPVNDGERFGEVEVQFLADEGRQIAVVAADTEWRIVLEASGLSLTELRGAVGSIPVLAQRDRFAPTDTRPITGTVTSNELAAWLESGSRFQMMEGTHLEPLVPGGHHQDVVAMEGGVGSGGTLLAILCALANPLVEVAIGIAAGRLFEFDGLPVVAGSDTDASRAHVIWCQRDRFWHLMRLGLLDELLSLAERISRKVTRIE